MKGLAIVLSRNSFPEARIRFKFNISPELHRSCLPQRDVRQVYVMESKAKNTVFNVELREIFGTYNYQNEWKSLRMSVLSNKPEMNV